MYIAFADARNLHDSHASCAWREFTFVLVASLVDGGISVKALTFLGSGFMPCLEMISAKNGTHEHLKQHLPLFSFRFTSLHIHCIPNTFCNSLNISSICL